MENKNKIPITRLNKYYTDIDFKMDLEAARDIIEGDGNFTVILYRIDHVNTNSDDIYGESKINEVRYQAPVELKVIVTLDPAEKKAYNTNGTLRNETYGNLHFTVIEEQLIEKQVDISYGDIVGYPDRENNLKYFSVSDPNYVNTATEQMFFGYKPYFREVVCVTINDDEFNGI